MDYLNNNVDFNTPIQYASHVQMYLYAVLFEIMNCKMLKINLNLNDEKLNLKKGKIKRYAIISFFPVKDNWQIFEWMLKWFKPS